VTPNYAPDLENVHLLPSKKKSSVLNFVERITEFISTNETYILSIEDLDMVEVVISDKYCSVFELWKC